jgi:hypothetical protein
VTVSPRHDSGRDGQTSGVSGSEGASDVEPPEHAIVERAELLPEERKAGSDDPHAQAEAVLEESVDRTEHPDPDASSQSGRRSSADTV